MECPYCRQEMKRGYLGGDGRRSVRWHEEGKRLTVADKLVGSGTVAKLHGARLRFREHTVETVRN